MPMLQSKWALPPAFKRGNIGTSPRIGVEIWISLDSASSHADNWSAMAYHKLVVSEYQLDWVSEPPTTTKVYMSTNLKKGLLKFHIPNAVFSSLVAGYFFWQVVEMALSGHFMYSAKANIGHPIDISITEMPVTFLGLSLIQVAIGLSFGVLAFESAYHLVRILKPSLRLSLRPQFKYAWLPFALLIIGATLLLMGVLNIVAIMVLNK